LALPLIQDRRGHRAPALLKAFIVNLIAATGVVNAPQVAVDDPLMLEKIVGADAPLFGLAPGLASQWIRYLISRSRKASWAFGTEVAGALDRHVKYRSRVLGLR